MCRLLYNRTTCCTHSVHRHQGKNLCTWLEIRKRTPFLLTIFLATSWVSSHRPNQAHIFQHVHLSGRSILISPLYTEIRWDFCYHLLLSPIFFSFLDACIHIICSIHYRIDETRIFSLRNHRVETLNSS